jgi:hypothetical protein
MRSSVFDSENIHLSINNSWSLGDRAFENPLVIHDFIDYRRYTIQSIQAKLDPMSFDIFEIANTTIDPPELNGGFFVWLYS